METMKADQLVELLETRLVAQKVDLKVYHLVGKMVEMMAVL